MALKFIEGFDDGMSAQRGSFPVDLIPGRFGGNAGQITWFANVVYTLPFTVTGTFIMGVAVRMTASLYYHNVLTVGMLNLRINPAGAVEVYNGGGAGGGGTLSGVSSTTPFNVTNVWRYVEIKYVLGTGAVTIRIDGQTALTVTVGTVASVGTIAWGIGNGNSSSMQWDDVYICDATGTVNNDFLGDVRVQLLLPSADGANAALTPSTGTSHAALVNETVPNTTNYVSSSVLGAKDTYQFQDLAANTANVFGIEVANYASKDAAGPGAIKNIARVNGIDYASATKGLSASWTANTNILEVNPATNNLWAPSDVNNAEFGVEVA